jgi:hypothetical protein
MSSGGSRARHRIPFESDVQKNVRRGIKRSDLILSGLLLLGAAVTAAYWLNYFVAGDVRVVPDLWYSAFEDAFPVADAWMSLCMIAAGIGLLRGARSAPLFGLMAGSALVYLAALDITFNFERGLYRLLPASGAMVTEATINVGSLALGIVTLTMCWRRATSSPPPTSPGSRRSSR